MVPAMWDALSRRWHAGVCCALLGTLAAQAPVPLADAVLQKQLESSARQLARLGLGDAAGELVDRMVDFGAEPKAMQTLRTTLVEAAGKVKNPKAAAPDVGKALRRTATALAARLPLLGADARPRAARALLLVDAAQAAAHEAVGHVLVEGRFVAPDAGRRSERRAAIEEAIRQARRLPATWTIEASDDPLLTAVLGRPGVRVRGHGLDVHSSWSAVQLQRVLTETLRALAVGNWLLHGEVAIPSRLHPSRWILLHQKMDYEKAVDQAATRAELKEPVATVKQMSCFFGHADFVVDWNRTEADTQASLISRLAEELTLPCLTAGHVNWLCLRLFGTTLPGYVIVETKPGQAAAGTTASPAATAERERLQRFAKAGLLGSRTWMAWLVNRGEDPPWSRSFVDQLGKLVGDDLCKTTLVMDHLYEGGQLAQQLRQPTRSDLGVPAQITCLEQALGEPLATFEERWRDSLRTQRPCLADRLDARKEPPADPLLQKALGHLGALRQAALLAGGATESVPVEGDASLSQGARLHAEYLVRHPDQLEAWPDAHEEFPDREGHSAAGAWGGLHSVIAPGVTSPIEAIDVWMATFYHRLPLLEDGLLRIGYGQREQIAVLDAGSLSGPRRHRSFVLWPHDGMNNVPLRFAPELPNPVPGADQSQWGYPVTLQLGEWSSAGEEKPALDVRVTLHAGAAATSPEVPCHVSSPGQPSNPELAPDNTWCLIPKAPLAKGATYTIVVVIAGEGDRVSRFRT